MRALSPMHDKEVKWSQWDKFKKFKMKIKEKIKRLEKRSLQ